MIALALTLVLLTSSSALAAGSSGAAAKAVERFLYHSEEARGHVLFYGHEVLFGVKCRLTGPSKFLCRFQWKRQAGQVGGNFGYASVAVTFHGSKAYIGAIRLPNF